MIVDYIDGHKVEYGVGTICRVLTEHGCKIAPSTYYDRTHRQASARAVRDEELTAQVSAVHAKNYSVYGARKVWLAMNREGTAVARCTVERLMRRLDLTGARRGKVKRTTIADPQGRRADDLVDRRFDPQAPNRLWVADFTYVSTWSGWVYVAFVIDAYSRRILGWRSATTMTTKLVLDAIEHAIWTRQREGVQNLSGLIHHNDRGSQGGFNWSSQHLDHGGAGVGRENKRVPERPAGTHRRQWAADRALRPAMRSPGRPEPSRAVQREFWQQIASGVTTAQAAEAVGVSWPVGTRWFRHAGGMPPLSLDEPTGRYLSFAEREEIALLRAQEVGVREIARRISRDPGTVSRELRRNAATRSGEQVYRAGVAQWKAQQAAKRPKVAKLVGNIRLREYVQERLSGAVRRADGVAVKGPVTPAWKGLNKPHRQDRRWSTAWSPEQISHRLKVEFPDDQTMRISHEAIYQSLFIQGRGALKRELVACLRTGRALRVPRARSQNKPQGHVTAEVVLSQRPAEAADRAVPGHWEGDLVRHEALCDRAGVGDLRRCAVAAA